MKSVIEEIKVNLQTDAFKLFYIFTTEEQKAVQLVKELAKEKEATVYSFDVARGLVCEQDRRVRNLSSQSVKDLHFVLDWLRQNGKGFVIFLNINPILESEPPLLRAFKNFLNSIIEESLYLKVFLISQSPLIPSELQLDSYFIDFPLPSRKSIEEILRNFENFLGQRLSQEVREEFINALQGMREIDIINVIKYCLYDGKLTREDIKQIIKMKRQIIKKEGLLEIVEPPSGLQDVGGMGKLKDWLRAKGVIIRNLDEAVKFKVDIPKGILLFGMPGCGKSLAAKAIAYEWNLPLLRLDMGMILGPYVGQSEENIRRAIKVAESISPCVLWIDELEKGFAGIGEESGGGVMRRVFGSFLTWMQEKIKPVFVVATANSINNMPPEFLRKGRFDEIFYVDFPSESARREIMRIHLRKRNVEHWYSQLETFIPRMSNYSGADIEAVISELLEKAFIATREGRNFEPRLHFESIIKDFKPLSDTMKEEIEKMKNRLKSINAKSVE